MIYFDEARVAELLQWEELIAAMEDALVAFSTGLVAQPVRTILTVEEQRRYFGIMPCVARDVMGAKLVSFYPANEGTASPTHAGIVVLLDAHSGTPLAAMDGRLITEMRTAAVSAAVTKHLMRPDARVLGILGSGVQAHSHLQALGHVAHFDEVRVWSRNPRNALRFAREHGAHAASAQDAVTGADVVVVATSASEPVLMGHWLKPGAHVNAVGANRPDWRELDDVAMRNTVVVDSREAAAAESGDVILSAARVYAEAGEIIAGRTPAPPHDATTIFKSLGLAVEDLYAAKLVYEAAAAAATRPFSGKG